MGIEDILDDDEDMDQREDNDKGNAAFAKMRRDLKAAEKRAQEAETRLADREKTERATSLKGTFESIGLKPSWAKHYPSDAEVTEDAVKAWAVAEEFLTLDEGESLPEPASRGFTPTVVTEAGAPPAQRWTKAEFEAGMRENPNLWRSRFEAGRVKLNNS